MKKILYLLIIAATALSSCAKEEQQATKLALEVVLSTETLEMKVGETAALTARTLPAAVGQEVTWSVLNDKVATVENGVVKAVAPGVTYVVATSQDGAVKSSCLVSVIKVPTYDFILLDANGNEVKEILSYPGYTTQIDVFTTDSKAHNNITWESSNTAAVQVKNGKLTLKAVASTDADYVYYGESTITLRTEDGYGCRFKVVSNVASTYLCGGQNMTFGDELNATLNSSHNLEFYCFNGVELLAIPVASYTLASDNSNITVQKNDNKWQLKIGNKEAAQANLTFKIADATSEFLKVTAVK